MGGIKLLLMSVYHGSQIVLHIGGAVEQTLVKREGVHEHTRKKTLGFSRATYFCRKRALSALIGGAEMRSRRPKRLRTASWGEPQLELILQIRRAT
jgi:hypothetical protein